MPGVSRSIKQIAVRGRAAEVGFVNGFVTRTLGGHGSAVLFMGEPGIGKSTLLAECVALIDPARVRVLRGQTDRLSRPMPFALVASTLGAAPDAADEHLRRLGLAISGTGPGSGWRDVEWRVVELVVSTIERWCAAGPVALVLDDLHWADTATMLVLRRLVPVMGQLPLLVLATARRTREMTDVDSYVAELGPLGHIREVGPLDDESISGIAATMIGLPIGASVEPVLRGVAGNPLFLIEAIAALVQDNAIRQAGGVAELVRPGLPGSLVDAVVRRLRFLSPRAFTLCQIAAVAGRGFTVRELGLIAGELPTGLLEPIMEARAAGLIQQAGHGLQFRHELIRQALADELPLTMREAIHLQAARALHDAGLPVDRVAEHLRCVQSEYDQWVVSWLATAADELTRRAPEVAVHLIGRALKQAGRDRDVLVALQAAYGSALLWCGDVDDAITQFRLALRLPLGALEAEVRQSLLVALQAKGDLSGSMAEIDAILRLRGLSRVRTLRVQATAAVQHAATGDLDEAVGAARLVLGAAEQAGDPAAQSKALYAEALAWYKRDDLARSLALLDDAAARAAVAEVDFAHLANVHTLRAATLMYGGHPDAAAAALTSAHEAAEHVGGILVTWAHQTSTALHFLTGAWDDAIAEAEAGALTGFALGMLGMAAQVALHRGDTVTAQSLLADIATQVPVSEMDGYLDGWTAAAMSLHHETKDEIDLAIAVLSARPAPWAEPLVRRMFPLCRALSLAHRHRRPSRTLWAAMESAASGSTNPTTLALVAWASGLTRQDPDVVADAAAQLESLSLLPTFADCLRDLAMIRVRLGDTAGAKVALCRAVEMFEQLDAAWDVARINQDMRALGLRRGVRGSRQRPSQGWASLTDTELRVARQVASGMSNSAIALQMSISRRTVQSHVSRVLSKLQLSSRVEIAAEVTRQEAS